MAETQEMTRDIREECRTVRGSILYVKELAGQIITPESVQRLQEIGESPLPSIHFKQEPGVMKFAFYLVDAWFMFTVEIEKQNQKQVYKISYEQELLQPALERYVQWGLKQCQQESQQSQSQPAPASSTSPQKKRNLLHDSGFQEIKAFVQEVRELKKQQYY